MNLNLGFRRAMPRDAFGLMQLYQLANPKASEKSDEMMLYQDRLSVEIAGDQNIWLIGERGSEIVLYLGMQVDRINRLAKITRVAFHPDISTAEDLFEEAMPQLLTYLAEKGVEVVYTTTRTITLAQQEITLRLGFKMLGVFPNAFGGDPLKINGLSAYFFDGVLKNRKKARFSLHPNVAPYYEKVRQACGLEELPVAKPKVLEKFVGHPLPELEIIHAPKFVTSRFEKLRGRQALSVHFYPFHEPNVLITDPDQKIEIFVKMVPEQRFAAILGERLDIYLNPVELYQKIAVLLNQHGITYLEVINDAGDLDGTQAIIDAGFLPCAYFPCFKKLGEGRWDYTVFSCSFEKPLPLSVSQTAPIHPAYLDFLREYRRQEAEKYLAAFSPTPALEPMVPHLRLVTDAKPPTIVTLH